MPTASSIDHLLAPLEQVNRAAATGDETAFLAALDELTHARETGVLADVRRLSDTLMVAVSNFRDDSRIATLAVRDMPDARLRLDHVVALTEQAAHRTLDLIEQSVPLADTAARACSELKSQLDDLSHAQIRAVLDEAGGSLDAMRGNLQEVMLAQGFQDITGQILRGVHALIGEVETVLAELAQLTGGEVASPVHDGAALAGPAVPGVAQGVVSDQSDVDDLMARLGL